MTRSMIRANAALFLRLADYCADRGLALAETDAARWVSSNAEADDFLKELKVLQSISFGRHRHLAQLRFRMVDYYALVGFDAEPTYMSLTTLSDAQGFDVCIVSELLVQPTALPDEIRNIYEAGSAADPSYNGHENTAVLGLFPSVQIAQMAFGTTSQDPWAPFFAFCVTESRFGSSWIEEKLSNSLRALAELNLPLLPYDELCRAVLDLVPRSLFMTLYRCLEATYAYDKATRLASALGISSDWSEVAAVLEETISWRPIEQQSLTVALAHAQDADLKEICSCLGVVEGLDIKASAGRAIYKLRNRIVHFRPSANRFHVEDVEWNRLCNCMVTIAMDVFHEAYS